METTIEGTIERLNTIRYDEWDKLNDIKIKCIEMLKRLPETDQSIMNINTINYAGRKPSPHWGTPGTQVEAFNIGVAKFKTYLEAYLELNEHSDFNKLVSDLKGTINNLEKVNNNLQRQIEEKDNEIKKLRFTKKWGFNPVNAIVTIAIGGLSVGLAFGYYWGNNKFDSEKNKMYNENQSLQKENKALKATQVIKKGNH